MGLYIGNTRYSPVIGKGNDLPYDAEIEYLMTDGNAYIDTGIQCKCMFEIVGGIDRSLSSAIGFFGYRQNATSNALCVLWYGDGHAGNTGKLRFDIGISGSSVQNMTSSSVANNALLKYNLMVFKAGNQTITPTLNSEEPTIGNLYLFGVNNNGTVGLIQNGTYVECAKICGVDFTIRDYIPVRKGTVGYLYDKISGQLFGNAGTGSFILGNDKNT